MPEDLCKQTRKKYLLEYLKILLSFIKKSTFSSFVSFIILFYIMNYIIFSANDTKMQCEIEASLQKFGLKSEATSENLNCNMRIVRIETYLYLKRRFLK